jgi:hypothetical protein
MDIGLLWFDDDRQRGIEEKVLRAAAHYFRKYGHHPNVCFVHPSMLDGNGKPREARAGDVVIRPGRAITRHHFWLGVSDEKEGHESRASVG